MAKKKDRVETMVRIDPRVKMAFKMSILDLSLSDRAKHRGSAPTMELVTAALWRWFSGLPRAEAEEFLAREFPRLEETMTGPNTDHQSEPDIPSHNARTSPEKRKGRTA